MEIKKLLADEWQNTRQLRYLQIEFDPARCIGTWQCYEVCPIGLWTPEYKTRLVKFNGPDECVACGACVLQCPENAIQLTLHQ